ncbi:MAG: glutamate mutase L [Sciscionella sp.]
MSTFVGYSRRKYSRLLCLDVGSTWTKGALVSHSGELLGTAQHPTTTAEVLDGIAEVTAALDATSAEVLMCSSAGGGLRLAVVGQERLISAEAGYRAALSAGAKVVHVAAGRLDTAAVQALRASTPDILLLTGGTDGGDEDVVLHNANRLARARIGLPIVLAANAVAAPRAMASLLATGRTATLAANVLPDVGELAPGPARDAIRAMFLKHVIGGKGLSRGRKFRRLVRSVTPDAVLSGVAALADVLGARGSAGAVLVVDVGGATTDVYSSVPGTQQEEIRAVGLAADRRTVEGDLGMRFSAREVIEEAFAEGLIAVAQRPRLRQEAAYRARHIDFAPTDEEQRTVDGEIARLAAVLAVRRHLRLVEGRLGPRGAGLLVLSGGVFRHAGPDVLAATEKVLRADPLLRPVLRDAAVAVDLHYVLAPAGLLAAAGREPAAHTLLATDPDLCPTPSEFP